MFVWYLEGGLRKKVNRMGKVVRVVWVFVNGKVMQWVGENVEISVQWGWGYVWVEKAEK